VPGCDDDRVDDRRQMKRVQHRQAPSELEGGSVEGVLADHVHALRCDRFEHRPQRRRDAWGGRRRRATGHDQCSRRVEGRPDGGKLDAGDLGPFGAVEGHVMAFGDQAGGQVADERLRPAELRRAQRRHRRGDDSDSHDRALV